jgi:hypothetical protein
MHTNSNHPHAPLRRLLCSLTSDETRQGANTSAYAVLEAVGHVVMLTVLIMVVGTLVVVVMVVDASVNAVEVAVPLLGGVEVLEESVYVQQGDHGETYVDTVATAVEVWVAVTEGWV